MSNYDIIIKNAVENMEIFGDSAGWYAETKINNLIMIIDFEFNCFSVYLENQNDPYQADDMIFSESVEELKKGTGEGKTAWRTLYNTMGENAARQINAWYPGRIKFIKA